MYLARIDYELTSFKTPVRDENAILDLSCAGRKIISEIIRGTDEKTYAAIRAAEYAIVFLELHRRAALRTLVLDAKHNGLVEGIWGLHFAVQWSRAQVFEIREHEQFKTQRPCASMKLSGSLALRP
jgi:hypothetical protein